MRDRGEADQGVSHEVQDVHDTFTVGLDGTYSDFAMIVQMRGTNGSSGRRWEKASRGRRRAGRGGAAATDKEVIFEGGAGGLKADSVIWIASMTKAVDRAAAMQLVERGKLTLDGPASDVVPELRDQACSRALTRRQGDHARKPSDRSPCAIC
jgi:hypothetical protein